MHSKAQFFKNSLQATLDIWLTPIKDVTRKKKHDAKVTQWIIFDIMFFKSGLCTEHWPFFVSAVIKERVEIM